MKLNLSRRDFSLIAGNMLAGSLGAGALFGAGARDAEGGPPRHLRQRRRPDYIRAKGLSAKTFGPNIKTDFVTVRAGSEVIAAMAGGSLDMCNLGLSPLVVGYANGVPVLLVSTSTRRSSTARRSSCRTAPTSSRSPT